MKGSVHVDARNVLKHLAKASEVVSGKDPDIAVFASKQHESEIDRAFQSKVAPSTGRRWDPRRHGYPWTMLEHTGTLKGALLSGFGIKTRSGKMKVFGKVREGFYLGGYSRGGGGSLLGAHKPVSLVAAAVMFGRKNARSAAGMRAGKGGRSFLHGGGSRLKSGASTGTTPPRPFFGFGQMAKFRVRRFAQRRIKQVFA